VKRRASNSLVLTVFLLVLLVILPACRRRTELPPTALPTLTPTPRSTPLPAVATAVPVGSEDSPVRMLIQPFGDRDDAESAAEDFQATLTERTGFTFVVQLVDRPAEALAALCASSGAGANVAWLSGAAYGVAALQECGQPLAQVERRVGNDTETGRGLEIIVRAELGLESVVALDGRTFCRLGPADFYSWLGLGLALAANELSPVTNVETIRDVDDLETLIRSVAEGECDAAGIPAGSLRELEDDLGEAAEQVQILDTTPAFPYAVLTASAGLPLGIREALIESMPELADDNQTALLMRPLLGQAGVIPANEDDFDDLLSFLRSTGLDFSQLGQ
jgi:ABC-type phosphate/phosphonate transport system substrate-binding protein